MMKHIKRKMKENIWNNITWIQVHLKWIKYINVKHALWNCKQKEICEDISSNIVWIIKEKKKLIVNHMNDLSKYPKIQKQ